MRHNLFYHYMTSFDTLQSISSRLNELTSQLSTSKLSKEELVEFETLSRKLYERAVILNYKAKEESVYGKSTDKVANPILPFLNKEEEVEPIETKQPIAENYMEAIVEQHEIVEEEEEIIEEYKSEEVDSDIHEESTPEKAVVKDDGRVQFDFSGGFDTAKVAEKSAHESETVAENPNNKKEESINEIVEDIQEEEPKVEVKKAEISEPITEKEAPKEEKINESIAQKEETLIQEKPSTSLNEVLQGGDDKTASFYARFSKANKEARGDRLGTSKISSLKGAIGLNDRLQFINELFDGDSNLYNDTIDQLDRLESNEASLKKLSEIAAHNNWNKEDSSVDEFGHFITRRYVD